MPVSSPIALSQGALAALHHLRERREINTVVLRCGESPDVLLPDLEGNLTHDELVRALPADEPRLVLHSLCFATADGSRRIEPLLILWMPRTAEEEEKTYTAGFAALKEYLGGVHVHLTARRASQLEYRRLVALAG
ncbi:cofilin family protein [Streptomyces sp. NPDC004436]